MNSTQPAYNTAALRRLIMQAFSDEEFTIFCFDHFREVRQQFTTGMTLLAKTQLLIEHCERTNAFPHLLPLLAEANPAKYAEFAGSLQKPAPQSPITNLSQAHTEHSPITNLQSALSPRQPFEPEMILIPAGEFLMGSDLVKDRLAFDDEQPQHLLYLVDYYIAKTPVTNAQYSAFVLATHHRLPEHWSNRHPSVGKHEFPVVNITWYDALAYCNWLAEVTNKSYCLPSEAEWEKGARGLDGRIYPWGNEWRVELCNCIENGLGTTTAVNTYPGGISPYGLFDMVGNVLEWTRSLWGRDWRKPDFKYPYCFSNNCEDVDASNEFCRVVRGGSFASSVQSVRCSNRAGNEPDKTSYDQGFRVAMSPF